MTIRQRVLYGLGWLVAGRGIAQAIRWVATIYVIRLLAPEDYGIVAVATVLFGLLIRLCDAGFGNAVVVTDDTDKRTLQEFFGFLLIVSFVLGLLHLLSAPLLAAFFKEPRIVPVVQVLSLGFIFTAVSIIPTALLTKKMRFKRFAIASSIATLTGTVVTVALAFTGHAFWSLIIGQLATQLATAVVFMAAAKCWLLPRFPGRQTMSLISVGSSITAASLLWYFYTKLDVFIAGRLWNSTVLGYYSVPVHLARLPAGKVMPLLRKIAMPSFAQIRENPSAVRYYFRRTFALGALVSFAVFFGIASVAASAVPLILGEKWTPSIWLLFAVCLGMPFSGLIGLYSPILQATGQHKMALSNTTIALLLFSVTFTLGALVGPLGLASAWAVSFPILFAIVTVRSAPKLNVKPAEVFSAIRGPMIAGVLMLGVNLALQYNIPWDWPPAAMLAMQIVVGTGVYFLALVALDKEALLSSVQMFRGKRAAAV